MACASCARPETLDCCACRCASSWRWSCAAERGAVPAGVAAVVAGVIKGVAGVAAIGADAVGVGAGVVVSEPAAAAAAAVEEAVVGVESTKGVASTRGCDGEVAGSEDGEELAVAVAVAREGVAGEAAVVGACAEWSSVEAGHADGGAGCCD